jgi:hypothetical protein
MGLVFEGSRPSAATANSGATPVFGPENGRPSLHAIRHVLQSNTFWLAANGLSLLALSLIMFRLQAPVTYFRWDGTFILSVVKSQSEWMRGLGPFVMDFLRGIGGISPTMDTRLMPGFIVGLMAGNGNWLAAVSATWFAAEFAVATVLLGRMLNFSITTTVAAVWIGLFGGMPYLTPVPAIERMWGNPPVLSIIAWTMVALMLFLAIGRRSRANSIACTAALLLSLFYLTLVTPLWILLFLPVLGFFGIVGMTMANDKREIAWKLAAGVAVILIYFITVGPWLAGLFLDAKTTFFWSELYTPKITWNWASLLVEDPVRRPAGVALLLLAISGGVMTVVNGEWQLRRFAIGYLVFVGLLWAISGFLVLTQYSWPGPTISYLDWMIYPFHALFAARFLYCLLLAVSREPRWRSAASVLILAFAAFAPWTALAVWSPPYPRLKNAIPFRWPPLRTPVVNFLEREIALRPGQPFRGRVVNLAGGRWDPEYYNIPFVNQHNYDAMVVNFTGNDHREYGFWFYDIPTLENSDHMISPFFHLLVSRFLMPKGVLYMRPHEWATVFNEKMLALIGVRYVLTEAPLSDRVPTLKFEIQPTREQYLYELPNPNIGGRGVVRWTAVTTAGEAVERMRSPGYDYDREAVLFEPLPKTEFAPVSHSSLIVHRGYLTVSAEAPGPALLVLPIEYSRCLQFTWLSAGTEPPQAVRADLDETAISFTGRLQARIAFRSDPLENPTCRLRDWQDAVHLGVGVQKSADVTSSK